MKANRLAVTANDSQSTNACKPGGSLRTKKSTRMWRSKAKAADEPRKDSTISSAIENSSVAAKDCAVK